MELVDFQNLTPEMLKKFINKHTESSYRLVDVRQPDEYETAHIPGAHLIPLPDLETRLYELPEDQDLIFYCHSGGRSAYAATLAVEGEVTSKPSPIWPAVCWHGTEKPWPLFWRL